MCNDIIGVVISLAELLHVADKKAGYLEVKFEQKEIQLDAGDMTTDTLIDLEENKRVYMRNISDEPCIVSLSAVASHKLLKDWSLISKSYNANKRDK